MRSKGDDLKEKDYYLIHYPIKKNEEGTSGGPFCMMTPGEAAYVAFKSVNLAEYFMKRMDRSVRDYNIIKVNELGLEYPELMKGVTVLLFFPSKEVVDELIKDFKNFAYEDYLIDREDIKGR